MWEHRNKSLFPGTSTISLRRKQKIWRDVKIELSIGNKCIRTKDQETICMKKRVLKTWTAEAQEIWLKNIKNAREQSLAGTSDVANNTYKQQFNAIYRTRSSLLRQLASPKFHKWRMKHHNKTLSQYLHSTDELRCQLKRQKLANHWVSSQPFVPGHCNGTGKLKAYRAGV